MDTRIEWSSFNHPEPGWSTPVGRVRPANRAIPAQRQPTGAPPDGRRIADLLAVSLGLGGGVSCRQSARGPSQLFAVPVRDLQPGQVVGIVPWSHAAALRRAGPAITSLRHQPARHVVSRAMGKREPFDRLTGDGPAGFTALADLGLACFG